MPDWEAIIRQKLGGLAFETNACKEIAEELVGHLDEMYTQLCKEGKTEEHARQRVLDQVEAEDWPALRRKIQSARLEEGSMTNRVRQFLFPGLVTFLLAAGALGLLEKFGPRPWVVALRGVLPVGLLYIPWLLTLPLIGAVGAYLSLRAGGSGRAVLSSILFPVLPFLVSILLVLPVSLFFDRFIAHNIAPMSLVMALLGWVVIPGVALLAGGLPTKFLLSRRSTSRSVVST